MAPSMRASACSLVHRTQCSGNDNNCRLAQTKRPLPAQSGRVPRMPRGRRCASTGGVRARDGVVVEGRLVHVLLVGGPHVLARKLGWAYSAQGHSDGQGCLCCGCSRHGIKPRRLLARSETLRRSSRHQRCTTHNNEFTVLYDSGIRRGSDAIKVIAMGA